MGSDNFQADTFGFNNFICTVTHKSHMWKASELQTGMDLMMGKRTTLQALLHEIVYLCEV